MSEQSVSNNEPSSTSRRYLLGKGVLVAAAATAATLANATSASAADGDLLVIGDEAQTAQSPTEILANGFAGGSVFVVNDTPYPITDATYEAALSGRSSNRSGVHAFSDAPGAYGAVGISSQGIGVFGWHSASTGTPAPGVLARSDLGVGVLARGNVADVQLDGNGFLWFSKPGLAPNPTGFGGRGAIARDAAGGLWYCYEDGKWRELAGPTTGGAFHPITPVRVYDSRAAAPMPGTLAPNSNRLISVKDGRGQAGNVTAVDIVPVRATAITYNVTATGTTGPNFLAVVPGDAPSFSTSSLNWAGGYDIANGGTVKLDANRQVKVFLGDQAGSSHVILDVTGYYL
jgi:hypothetical protein